MMLDAEPEFDGGVRKVWAADNTTRPGDPPDWQACLGTWFIHAPDAHPLWRWYVATVFSLRDIPNVEPAIKRYESAEHELVIASVHPSWEPTTDPRAVPLMTPLDCAFQFDGLGDEGAARFARAVLRHIADGSLTPDSDRRGQFHALLVHIADHLKGKHGPIA